MSNNLFTGFLNHDRARIHNPLYDDTGSDGTDSGILITIALGSI